VVGSRRSNELQRNLLEEMLAKHKDDTIVSGGCYAGADKWAEEFADANKMKKIIHESQGTFPKDFHARNKLIVRDSDELIATIPENPNPERFAGTEQTVREAIKKGIPTTLIDPKGKIFKYNMAAKRVFKKGKYHATLSGPEVRKLASEVQLKLRPLAKKIEIAGSIRREIEPVDVDIVMIPKDKEVIKNKLAKLGRITRSGKDMVETKIKGVDVDVYFTEPKYYGGALLTYTGSFGHNIGLRQIARKQGKILNQRGIFNRKTGKYLAGKTEWDIYKELGRPRFKKPEERE
jgi:hypothetical protein